MWLLPTLSQLCVRGSSGRQNVRQLPAQPQRGRSTPQRSPPARRTGWSRRPRRQWAEQQRMGCGATSTPDREVSSRARVSHLLVHAPYRVVRNNGHHSTLAEGPRQTLVLAEEPLRKEGFQALRSQGSLAASHPPAPPELQLS